jgi:hypothetical protein
MRARLIGSMLAGTVAVAAGQQGGLCTVTSRLTALPGLAEASGVALSRRSPGLLWSHNDSGDPVLFALDGTGAVKGRVTVAGAQVEDWEDVSAGPCPQGTCLYIADIGDNNRVRRRVRIYRMPEPRAGDGTTQPAEIFEAAYPDGAHDAEAVFVTGADAIYIVTKATAATTALYRWPAPLRAGSTSPLQLVARLPVERVTGADASPDGAWVALRTSEEVLFYPARDIVAGTASGPRRFDVRGLREPQGEGITLAADGAVYLVGEGRAGTLASLRCTLR